MNESQLTIERSDREIGGMVGVLWIVLALSLLFHIVCLVASRWFFQDWIWQHAPFHSAIEMGGGIVAFGVAWMLLSLEKLGHGTSFNVWIAAALIGMGVLDSIHAMVSVGVAFVWLHSLATFLGGVLFSMVWLPKNWQARASWWPMAIFVGTLLIGVFSIVFGDYLPVMSNDEGFTSLAKTLNIGGGVLMFAAAARMVFTYRQTSNSDDLLFCLHCALFGAAAIMFEQSRLWDLPWWGWHALRLMAYSVALWFVVMTDARTAKTLQRRAATQARMAALQENAEQMEAAYAVLEREQFLLNSLVNTIPDAVFFKDREGRVIRANQSMAHDAGFRDASELIGKTDREIWAGSFHVQTEKDEQRIMETGEAIVNKEEMPIAEGGNPRWVLVTKMPLYDSSGEVMGLFGVARDITEIKLQELDRKRQAEALAEAKDALERSNADLQQFAYVASHDLQEPLRAVSGHCQLLEMALRDNTDAKVQTCLGHAVDGAKRMQVLIENLLDYSRVESRGQAFVSVDAAEIVDEALSNLEVAIEERQANITVQSLPKITADREQLVRLFQNLIGNAIKFCKDDRPKVEVSAERDGDKWVFSVRDNGVGLADEYRDRIFVIFQRLHTRNEYPGTGLGLAIAKRIVERHGGRIWVESEPDIGSNFRFTLSAE